jgi:hypothetical protein
MVATMVDEYHGQGGTYLVDPKTGKRKLVSGSRTEPAPLPSTEVLNDAAPEPQTPDSGEN